VVSAETLSASDVHPVTRARLQRGPNGIGRAEQVPDSTGHGEDALTAALLGPETTHAGRERHTRVSVAAVASRTSTGGQSWMEDDQGLSEEREAVLAASADLDDQVLCCCLQLAAAVVVVVFVRPPLFCTLRTFELSHANLSFRCIHSTLCACEFTESMGCSPTAAEAARRPYRSGQAAVRQHVDRVPNRVSLSLQQAHAGIVGLEGA
jgi:hypothetical protein